MEELTTDICRSILEEIQNNEVSHVHKLLIGFLKLTTAFQNIIDTKYDSNSNGMINIKYLSRLEI